MQLSFTYLPIFNAIFSTAPLDLKSWTLILSLAVGKFFAITIEKSYWRKKGLNRM
jgi:hypothetical protein